jgi:hypothetical protein
VLSIYPDGARRILVSTNRTLDPEAILYVYGLRFKIEVSLPLLDEGDDQTRARLREPRTCTAAATSSEIRAAASSKPTSAA